MGNRQLGKDVAVRCFNVEEYANWLHGRNVSSAQALDRGVAELGKARGVGYNARVPRSHYFIRYFNTDAGRSMASVSGSNSCAFQLSQFADLKEKRWEN